MSSVNNSQKKNVDQIEGPWTPEEDEMLQILFEKHFPNWSLISKSIPGRSDQSCRIRWFTLKCVRLAALEDKTRLENNSATVAHLHEDITIGPPEELLDREHKTKNYLVAFEAARGQSPSIGDMAMDNVSQPLRGTHSYSRDQSAPSWNALNKQDSSRMMIDGDNVQAFVGGEIGSQNSIYEGKSSHVVGGVVNGQAPSISDMARGNMSSGVIKHQKKDMDHIEGPWSPEEDEVLENLMEKHDRNWSLISKSIPGRSGKSCRLRWLSLYRSFTPEEDEMLQNLVEKHFPNWSLISKSIPGRSAKSCWSRWSFVHRPFTLEEDEMFKKLIKKHGPNWPLISKSIPGRSANTCELRWETIWHSLQSHENIENHWNLTLKKKGSSMTNEDLTISDHNIFIQPPSVRDINGGQRNSYIHDLTLRLALGGVSDQAPSIGDMAIVTESQNSIQQGNLSHEVGGMVNGQVPSISDMVRGNMSSGCTHSFSRDKSAPSWNALNETHH